MKLEELIEHYDNEQTRLLSEIEEESVREQGSSFLNSLIEHPNIMSSSVLLAGILLASDIYRNGHQDYPALMGPLAGGIVELGVFSANDWKKGKKIDPSTFIAGATGAATALTFSAPFWHHQFYYGMDTPYRTFGFFWGGMEALLVKSALTLRAENLENRKNIAKAHKRNALDFLLLDLPTLPFIASGAVAYKLFNSGTGINVLEGDFIGGTMGTTAYYSLLTFLSGVTAYIGTQLASKYFDDSQRKRLFRKAEALVAPLFGRNDIALESLERIVELPLTPAQLAGAHYDIGRFYLKRNDYGRALSEFDAALRTAPVDREINSSEHSNKFARVIKSENVNELVRDGILFYSKGLALQGDFCLAKALYLNPQNKFLHWIRADALGMNGSHEEEKFERDTFLDLIFSEPDLQSRFSLQHDSRNEIAFLRDAEFPGFSIALKRSRDKNSIDLEHGASEYFAKALEDATIKPLSVREHDGFHYMVMPHAGSRLYEEVMRGNYRTEQFRTIIDFLVDYFIAGGKAAKEGIIRVDDVIKAERYRTIDGSEISNKDANGTLYFSNRIGDIVLGYLRREIDVPERIGNLINSNSWIFDRILESLELVVSKDANLKNFYVAPSGSIVAGDFESLKFIPVHCEISRLLEFGLEFLSEGEKSGLVEYFYTKWMKANENRKPTKAELKEFERAYEFASLYDNLILLGYRARDEKRALTEEEHLQDYREELFHLNSARRHISNILGLEGILEREKFALRGLDEGIEHFIGSVAPKYQIKPLKTNPIKMGTLTRVALGGTAVTLAASLAFWAFGRQSIKEEYTREAIGINMRYLSPKQEGILHIIDTRTGEELYNFSGLTNSFDWNPVKPALTLLGAETTLQYDLESTNKAPKDLGIYLDNLTWSPNGNYMATADQFSGIRIFDTHGNRIDIPGLNPRWAPNGTLLGYKTGEQGNLKIAELKGSRIKDTYSGPRIVNYVFDFNHDSDKIAYVVKEGENYVLYVSNSHFGNVEEVLRSEESISYLRWNPKEDILYFRRDGIYEFENGAISQVVSRNVSGFDIDKDGRILVKESGEAYGKLSVKDLQTGTEEVIAEVKNGYLTNALFTPDGNSVFYTVTVENKSMEAYLFDLQTGRQRFVMDLCPSKETSKCIIRQIK